MVVFVLCGLRCLLLLCNMLIVLFELFAFVLVCVINLACLIIANGLYIVVCLLVSVCSF